MCGIAGLFQTEAAPADLPGVVTGMLGAIAHRGPDGLGYAVDDRCAMGTVRLAILDPAHGAQPFTDAEGRFWLCYNGEIYNYRELRAELEARGHAFRTRCDTEVVLEAWRAWGADALPRFNGGFAFALYDRRDGRLVLARDRFGKRPLFFSRHQKGLVFASEMKAFLAVPGFSFRQDPAQIAAILAQWTPLPDQSGFEGIENLPMGCWLSVQDGVLTRHTYAALRFDEGPAVASEAEALALIQARLTESVAMRLRSDVEVGVYLSGGVDSAIVGHLTRQITHRSMSTFSVEFADAAFDESAEQRLMAEHLGSRHHALRVTLDDIAGACPEAVYHAEVPTFRSAFIPMFLLSRLTREAGIKVVLSGEGADEAYLGYDLFKETLLRAAWAESDEELRRDRLMRLYPHYDHFGAKDIAAVTGLYQQFAEERMPGLFSHELRFQNGRFSARLMRDAGDPFAALSALVADCPDYQAMSPVERAQWLEYKTLLPGYLLSTQGERMSLAHGVENRCPFLDKAVVDLAGSVNLRFDDGFDEKRLLRDAFAADLPEAVVRKRKFPYRAPDVAAFAAARPDYLELVESEAELAALPFLDARFAQRLTRKVLTSPAEAVSTKENQTFLFLLSTVLLHHAFVRRARPPESLSTRVTPPLEKVVDLRGMAVS
jgi:asparagine synthase (glutamine-hydrolysing)